MYREQYGEYKGWHLQTFLLSNEAHTVIKSSALEIKLNTVPGCLISFNCELT